MFFLQLIISYVIGMIPFGQIYAYILGAGNLRTQGSGNIGATNAYRVGGKLLGFLTLMSDIAKGFLPVFFFSHEWVPLFVVMGHIQFPFFTGGKGIATGLGVVFAINPWLGLSLSLIWILTLITFRISAVAGLVTFLSFPIIGYFFNMNVIMMSLISIIIVFAHRSNIIQMMRKNNEEDDEDELSATTT